MIKMFCDRCGKEIKGTTCYYIYFRADDIEANKSDIGVSLSTGAFNTQKKLEEISKEKNFCPTCIDKIIKFVGSNEDATN